MHTFAEYQAHIAKNIADTLRIGFPCYWLNTYINEDGQLFLKGDTTTPVTVEQAWAAFASAYPNRVA